ncbi:RluA family pseudouridine synthase [Candidatus Cytomitobacter indipagum]|uniref:RluA family pseudouridine synthase n=1 Tax=Candidatus Cytomitobacter indipagum TaxID=2601575 RepID=A0A5C0UEV4_9PROT|nr:RluA family pseudouridine synthase [Candidatus Cytomitobacter indipagum]QEK37802.1 RluA family pseudouridine synthase [Candidatus Cytomitobacter indipagum]
MKIKYKAENGLSIRQWFREHYINLTYNELQKYLRVKDITLNGKKVSPQHILSSNDIIHVWDKIPKVENAYSDIYTKELNSSIILYEDEDILAINKPYNMCSQGDIDDSAFLQVNQYAHKKGKKAYPVHRIDKFTTGVLIFALNRNTAMLLSESIKNWKKTYISLLPWSNLGSGSINTVEDGKSLITGYLSVGKIHIDTYPYEIVKFFPKTGKKHQIRRHVSDMGLPIVGDRMYGSEEQTRMHLHCREVYFVLNGKRFTIQAPLPGHMEHLSHHLKR